jgi:hypothetical protein
LHRAEPPQALSRDLLVRALAHTTQGTVCGAVMSIRI